MTPARAALVLQDFAPFELQGDVILSRDGMCMWEIRICPPGMEVDDALVTLLNKMVADGQLPGVQR